MSHDLTRTIIDKFLAVNSVRGMSVHDEVALLAPLFAEFDTPEAALLELHASMLRFATGRACPEDYTDAAAIVFGLVRAMQQAQRGVSEEVVLNTTAHVMCAVVTAGWDPDRSRHLDLARSWLAHAYLVAGTEAGDAR